LLNILGYIFIFLQEEKISRIKSNLSLNLSQFYLRIIHIFFLFQLFLHYFLHNFYTIFNVPRYTFQVIRYNILMLISIDISQLIYQGSGVANYTYNLVKNLLTFDKKNNYKLFFAAKNPFKKYSFLEEFKNLGAKIYRYPIPMKMQKFLWQKNDFLSINRLIGRCDIFYSSDFLRPKTDKNVKGITTIHDLSWKLYPKYHTDDVINAHEKKLEKTIKYNDEIIVDSENTKNDLLRLYPQIKEEKVHVIYPGVGEHFRKIEDKKAIEKVIKKYLKRFTFNVSSYMLYVGAIEPRKNLDVAIKVFHKLLNTKYLLLDTKFLIIGKAGWKNEKIFQLVKDLKLEDKVIFLGYVEDKDLPYFYSGATLTFYLSSYEGFGLPPLESLACGTPVLAGNNSSMKETLPRKFLVNEKDEEEIYKKVIEILEKKPKINFEKIKKNFSWKKTVRKIFSLIKN
jgi:glycosyltransferase involved in cell wall biosynthesis